MFTSCLERKVLKKCFCYQNFLVDQKKEQNHFLSNFLIKLIKFKKKDFFFFFEGID